MTPVAADPTTRPADAAAGPGTGSLLQRVILPRPGDPTRVRALYVDESTGTRVEPGEPVPNPASTPVTLTMSVNGGRKLRIGSRTTATVPAWTEVSFGAYFNAFAAGYWRRWSILTEIRLRLTVEGAGRVDVYRTKADGTHIYVRGEVLGTPGRHDVDLALDLHPFEDGGWYWFDLTTDEHELALVEGGWYADQDAPGRAAVTIGMPTFNRPADCVATLTAIGEDPAVLAEVTAVILPDQGTKKVRVV